MEYGDLFRAIRRRQRRSPWRLAMTIAAVALVGCGPESPGSPSDHGDVKRSVRRPLPHIVLVSIDTLRADHLSCYGYERETSPFLDSIAAEAVRFETARAQATATLTSHLSLMTSLLPPQLGMTRNDGVNDTQRTTSLRLSPNVRTLAERLREAGYRTAAITNGGFLIEKFGFHRGFDHFEVARPRGGKSGMFAEVLARLDRYLAQIDPRDTEPRFLFLHTYEVHGPYGAPSPFDRAFSDQSHVEFQERTGLEPSPKDLNAAAKRGELDPADAKRALDFYDNGIALMDSLLEQLVKKLRARGLYEDAHFVVFSDHGEEFQDHGQFGHGPSVYEELLHVPLIWRLPGGRNGGRVRPDPVQLLDVTPTLLEIANAPDRERLVGRSLWPVLDADAELEALPPVPIYADTPNRSKGARALLLGELKLVRRDNGIELYDLERDPYEREDLALDRPAEAVELQEHLDRWVRELQNGAEQADTLAVESGAERELSARERAQLEALGYVDEN